MYPPLNTLCLPFFTRTYLCLHYKHSRRHTGLCPTGRMVSTLISWALIYALIYRYVGCVSTSSWMLQSGQSNGYLCLDISTTTYVLHAILRLIPSPLGQDSLPTSQKLLWMSQKARTQSTSATLEQFPASGPLELVIVDLLEPLPKRWNRNQFVIVMADRNSKRTRAVPVSKPTAAHAVLMFRDNWIEPAASPTSFQLIAKSHLRANCSTLFAAP